MSDDTRIVLHTPANDLKHVAERYKVRSRWSDTLEAAQDARPPPTDDLTDRPNWAFTTRYTPCPEKKGATLFLPVTLRNANQFSKFFYHHTLQ